MNIQAAIAVALIVVSFGAGWQVSTWRHDSIELAVQSLAEQHRQQTTAAMSEISRRTAEAISQIRIENRTIYQKATREVIREPIYADCAVPADGSRCSMQPEAPPTTGILDQSLMMPCPPMTMIPIQSDGTITMGELMLSDIELAGMYRECAESKAGLVEAVSQVLGLEVSGGEADE